MRPIDIRTQLFAGNPAGGFAINLYSERFTAGPQTVRDIAKMATRCAAARRKLLTLKRRHGFPEDLKLHG